MAEPAEVRTLTVHEPTRYEPVRVADITTVMESLKAIRTFVAEQLQDGLDYGVIPGTGGKKDKHGNEVPGKKTLYLPGAQKVTMLFNCYPRHSIERREMEDGHVEFIVTTEIILRGSGDVIGSGIGSCSTMEGKYRFRTSGRVCPSCEKQAIVQTKTGRNPGGYWCVPDKGGCNANFNPGDPAVEKQKAGKVENDNIHDVRNTVLKMAKKRAWVDAALGLGCLAELFTQDIEDTYDLAAPPEPAAPPAPSRAESERLLGLYTWDVKGAKDGKDLANIMTGIKTDAVYLLKEHLDTLRTLCDARKKEFAAPLASNKKPDARQRVRDLAAKLDYSDADWSEMLSAEGVTKFDLAPEPVVAMLLMKLEDELKRTPVNT